MQSRRYQQETSEGIPTTANSSSERPRQKWQSMVGFFPESAPADVHPARKSNYILLLFRNVHLRVESIIVHREKH
jgi:hypothetical protein